jgi:hypothetical protein
MAPSNDNIEIIIGGIDLSVVANIEACFYSTLTVRNSSQL